ncbi:MAG: ABC transporter ATP-binding protein [Bacteroidota bacterium]|nr:ABC transporter ATP-binding protein [Bacteroidota bacterium]
MKKVILYMGDHIGMLLFAVALLFVQAMCDLALPDYMSKMVTSGIMNGSIPFIWEYGGKMLVATLFGTVASVTVGFIAAMVAASVAVRMRDEVFTKITSFSNAEFDQFGSASLITRTTNDITQVQNLLVMMIRLIFYAPILGVGGVIKAVSKSASMSWIVGIAVLCLICVMVLLFSIAMPKTKLVQKLVDKVNLVTRENLDGMLVIRAFNTQKFELKRFNKANVELTSNNLFVNRVMSSMMPIMMLIMNLTILAVVWVGSKLVSEFNLEIGDMMAYMQYAIQIIMAFLMLAVMFILVPRAAVSANRVAEVLDTPFSIKDKKDPEKFDSHFVPTVEFRNVDFTYPGSNELVLQNISFTAKMGETTAFIGATGSGKSTIVNLIMRFYDVTNGAIYIDGKDIRNISRRELRSKIGLTPQKGLLFSGTIKSNLYFANNEAKNEDLDRSTQIAQATEFISSKPLGYDEPVAQGGSNLSGGQRQRMAIARTLVKNSPIYIFDDSFSALDLKTDRNLRNALKNHTSHSTVLIVAQRISTILNAEQIVVLDNGKIAGVGTHRELLETCDMYKEIALSQLSEEELAR